MGCRLPGSQSPEEFWTKLKAPEKGLGRDGEVWGGLGWEVAAEHLLAASSSCARGS